jgi:hypothetical protein
MIRRTFIGKVASILGLASLGGLTSKYRAPTILNHLWAAVGDPVEGSGTTLPAIDSNINTHLVIIDFYGSICIQDNHSGIIDFYGSIRIQDNHCEHPLLPYCEKFFPAVTSYCDRKIIMIETKSIYDDTSLEYSHILLTYHVQDRIKDYIDV